MVAINYSLGRTAEENMDEMMEAGSQLYKVITQNICIHSSKLFVVSKENLSQKLLYD